MILLCPGLSFWRSDWGAKVGPRGRTWIRVCDCWSMSPPEVFSSVLLTTAPSGQGEQTASILSCCYLVAVQVAGILLLASSNPSIALQLKFRLIFKNRNPDLSLASSSLSYCVIFMLSAVTGCFYTIPPPNHPANSCSLLLPPPVCDDVGWVWQRALASDLWLLFLWFCWWMQAV